MITKELFDRLYSDSITKKEYDQIVEQVTGRVNVIVRKMRKPHPNFWWDYDNCSYEGENSNGYFDPQEYKEEIGIGGEWVNFPEPYDDGNFPTRWLWQENWEEEFHAHVTKYQSDKIKEKERLKKQKMTRESKRKVLQDSAMQKLTPEERWAVGLRAPKK